MKRREFIKGIFIVGAAAAIPNIVLSNTIPEFSTKIGEIEWYTKYNIDKMSYLHNAHIQMMGGHWNSPIYSESPTITPELEKNMIEALEKRWIQLNDA